MRVLRILLTRPEPDAARSAARLAALGHRVLIDPLLKFEPLRLGTIPPGPFAALAATSANAVRAAGEADRLAALRPIPLYAVGEHTAEAARTAGFKSVLAADGDAVALARMLGEHVQRGARILHLAGEWRAQDLAALLAPADIAVEVLVLYRMRSAGAFSKDAAAALLAEELDAVLHYSPRSAAIFAALAERQGLLKPARNLRHLCLSAAVAGMLAAVGTKVEIAARPDEAALLDLLDD